MTSVSVSYEWFPWNKFWKTDDSFTDNNWHNWQSIQEKLYNNEDYTDVESNVIAANYTAVCAVSDAKLSLFFNWSLKGSMCESVLGTIQGVFLKISLVQWYDTVLMERSLNNISYTSSSSYLWRACSVNVLGTKWKSCYCICRSHICSNRSRLFVSRFDIPLFSFPIFLFQSAFLICSFWTVRRLTLLYDAFALCWQRCSCSRICHICRHRYRRSPKPGDDTKICSRTGIIVAFWFTTQHRCQSESTHAAVQLTATEMMNWIFVVYASK